MRPQARTIRAVIEHLEEMGLEVMGPHTNLETGRRMGACMTYDADDVLRFRYLYEHDKLHDPTEDD